MMKLKTIFLVSLIIISVHSCKKDRGTLSEVVTYVPKFVSSTSATIGCTVTSDGGSRIVDCGLFIGLTSGPETNGTKLQMGVDTGFYLGRLTGLTPATQYFIKGYATNDVGVGLGDEVVITTPAKISDFDGNQYQTVIIVDKLWMAENLKTTHFMNGDEIPTTDPVTLDISTENSPEYQWSYDGLESNITPYGRLYTWHTVNDTRKICPDGWHVPTDDEWTALETTLGGYIIAGSRLKEVGNLYWQTPYNLDATNESCFTALPGGYRDMTGTFSVFRNDGYWWSATQSETAKSWARILSAGSPGVSRQGINKSNGLSVRCIKDN